MGELEGHILIHTRLVDEDDDDDDDDDDDNGNDVDDYVGELLISDTYNCSLLQKYMHPINLMKTCNIRKNVIFSHQLLKSVQFMAKFTLSIPSIKQPQSFLESVTDTGGGITN